MKNVIWTAVGLATAGLLIGCGSQSSSVNAVSETVADTQMTVELGCGMCTYSMPEADRCMTAAKIGDKVMLVDSDLNAHNAGLCEAPRQAVVMAHIDGDRLVASKVTLQ